MVRDYISEKGEETTRYNPGFEGFQTVPARPSGRGHTYDPNYFYDVDRTPLKRNLM